MRQFPPLRGPDKRGNRRGVFRSSERMSDLFRGDQLPAGACSQVMIRRQRAASALFIGACSQRSILRRPTTKRLKPLSAGWDRLGVSVSFSGASQYGLCSERGGFALTVDKLRSVVVPVIDNF